MGKNNERLLGPKEWDKLQKAMDRRKPTKIHMELGDYRVTATVEILDRHESEVRGQDTVLQIRREMGCTWSIQNFDSAAEAQEYYRR